MNSKPNAEATVPLTVEGALERIDDSLFWVDAFLNDPRSLLDEGVARYEIRRELGIIRDAVNVMRGETGTVAA